MPEVGHPLRGVVCLFAFAELSLEASVPVTIIQVCYFQAFAYKVFNQAVKFLAIQVGSFGNLRAVFLQ